MTLPLTRLKNETRELHGRVETNPLHRAIVEGTATRESYAALLDRMRGIHHTFEFCAALRTEWSEFGFNFEERRKLPLLERDLEALGVRNGATCFSGAPLPLVGATFPFLLGYLYVLEGSTLGGQVLARLLNQQLGIGPDAGAAYFRAYGPETGARWKSCQQLIENAVSTESAADDLVNGARDAFQRIDEWLRAVSETTSPTCPPAPNHTPRFQQR